MSYEEFARLAEAGNVVPLRRTMLADLMTPVSAYLALRSNARHSFLLESVEPNEKIGRHSFIGIDPIVTIYAHGSSCDVCDAGGTRREEGSIFELLAAKQKEYRLSDGGSTGGFLGGFVGYLGYDSVRHLERLPGITPNPHEEDEAVFGLYDAVVCFDHTKHTVGLVQNVLITDGRPLREQYELGMAKLDALELRLKRPALGTGRFILQSEPVEMCGREQYAAAVRTAKRHIVEGDIFQVVLSRCVTAEYQGDLFAVYRALRIINPSPYLFYLDFGDTVLVGSSPEVLVRVHGNKVEVLPIAGTRPRGTTEEKDRAFEQELAKDEKELAEHIMLVDLGRNDVGRIAEYGSVNVPVLKRVERYSHVMHLVSVVQGILRAGLSGVDALKACFPAGTVSGAPKVRAMEIISALEPHTRGAYAGAVGYVGFDGAVDTCIAIRTIVAHGNRLRIQAGAGIVADSIPEKEYEETVNKSKALLEAVTLAANGLRDFVS